MEHWIGVIDLGASPRLLHFPLRIDHTDEHVRVDRASKKALAPDDLRRQSGPYTVQRRSSSPALHQSFVRRGEGVRGKDRNQWSMLRLRTST